MTVWLVWRDYGHRQALIDLFTTELVAREYAAMLNKKGKTEQFYCTYRAVYENY